MMSPFLICEFAKETLSNLVKECFGTDFPDIIQKKQINFIYTYLTELNAKTVLLETDYVDRDYLEDYSRYYVKCFNRYGERCARLHFFRNNFDHQQFSKIFTSDDSITKELQENYLGYMVIKPLPKTFIGKTCLQYYPSFDDAEYKKVIRKRYTANLFGVKLKVDSVAFQEQDKILSACATTSIWSALHASNKHYSNDILSSGEITLSAINHITDSSNSFPNKGLTNKQILRALDTQKYRNHQVNFPIFDKKSFDSCFRIIKSYIDSDIPVILGANVYQINGDALEELGGHAVTILGYKEKGKEQALYIHDDRIGPFARVSFSKISDIISSVTKVDESDWCIALQEKSDSCKWLEPQQVLIPDSLIIPNHHKVRISSELINNTCVLIQDEFDVYLKELIGDDGDLPKLMYKIKLETLSKIRARVIQNQDIKNKSEILTKSAARFLWSATFFVDSVVSFEVLFDATDIPQGKIISNIIRYDTESSQLALDAFLGLLNADEPLPDDSEHNFLSAFINSLQKKENNHFDFLNTQFGELRAPKRLNASEIHNSKLQNQSGVIKNYGATGNSLSQVFPDIKKCDHTFMIWAISEDGALLIGEEVNDKGHPTLTGFKPARIAGELKRDVDGWFINSKSGRYSTDYDDSNKFLRNARSKFLEIYNLQCEKKFRCEEYHPVVD
jgi:hypothetical protein